MSKTNEALVRRWLASKHWGGWRAGMKTTSGLICSGLLECKSGCLEEVFSNAAGIQAIAAGTCYSPDLDHPGTRAFLLEDVRRAWGDAVYWMSGPGGHHVVKCGYQWFNEGKRVGNGLTEAEALVAALEAAPGE